MINAIKNRIEELDILKAIAIIYVSLGHVISVVNKSNNSYFLKYLFDFIYIWHIPLFFFVSGYLFKHDKGLSKNLQRLLLPCFVFSLPHFILHLKVCYWSEDLLTNFISELKFIILYGGYYWFINFLLIMNVISKIFIHKDSFIYNVCLVAFITVMYYCILIYLPQLKLTERFLYNYIFFIIGYVLSCKKIFENKIFIYWDIHKFWVNLSLIIILSFLYFTKSYFGLKMIIAFLIILFFSTVIYRISNKFVKDVLLKIGITTMPIYLLDGYLIKLEHKFFDNQIMYLPVMLAVNIFVPIFIYNFVSNYLKIRKFFGG